MSDTPGTDLAIKAGGGDWSPVLRVTSQRLERQRDEAREAIRALAEHGESEIQRITKERDEALNESLEQARLLGISGEWGCRLIAERDEAREQLENEMKWHHQTHKELVETQCKLMDITQERDEAMEKNAKLRDIAEAAIDWLKLGNPDDKRAAGHIRAELEQIKEGK